MINKTLAKINQYIDNNQNTDSNIIFEILVNLIKSHNQAHVFLEEVYFSKNSIEEQKKYIRKLEYDNAELVKRDKELNTRLKEISTYRKPKRFNRG